MLCFMSITPFPRLQQQPQPNSYLTLYALLHPYQSLIVTDSISLIVTDSIRPLSLALGNSSSSNLQISLSIHH